MMVTVAVPDDVTAEEVLAAIRAGMDRVYDIEDREYERLRSVAGNMQIVEVIA